MDRDDADGDCSDRVELLEGTDGEAGWRTITVERDEPAGELRGVLALDRDVEVADAGARDDGRDDCAAPAEDFDASDARGALGAGELDRGAAAAREGVSDAPPDEDCVWDGGTRRPPLELWASTLDSDRTVIARIETRVRM